MTKLVLSLFDDTAMDTKARYVIPAGTKVEVRDLNSAERQTPHVTRQELRFNDRSGTGYNGAIFYFDYKGWQIAVNADLIR